MARSAARSAVNKGGVFALCASAVCCIGAPARAQLLDQFISPSVYGAGAEAGVTVQSRARPEYDAAGLKAGAFTVRPQLLESIGYESNVLGTSRASGSPFVETNASLSAASDWSRDSLRAEVTVDDVRYLRQRQQSYTNWTAALGGTYEVGRDLVTARYQHLNLNQTVRDLDVPQLDEPIPFTVDSAVASYQVNLNRVSITPGLSVAQYAYSNGSVAGTTYRQDYRDRVVVTPSIGLGYEFAPRRSAVVVFRDAIASYSRAQAGQPRRDYNDAAILAGLDYDVTGLLRFRVLGGYEVRTFSNSAYKTISSPVLEASAIWSPTSLTTLTGTVARRIQDTSDESTAAFTQTSILLTVDHELLRNVLLRGKGGIYIGEYEQNAGTDQTLYTAGASVTYLANRYLRATAAYDFMTRQSSGGGTIGTTGQAFGSSYRDHRVLLQVRLTL